MKYFNTGGATGTNTMRAEESSLSSWAGPYVTEMLGRGQALAGLPYQAYMGPLTAGPSELQTQAFTGLGSLAVPTSIGEAATGAGQIAQDMSSLSYSPTQFTTGSFTDTGMAQQYMSPYLQAALEPQIAEAQRQAEIQRVQNAGRLSRAGAYGGGRQAIMESEGQRNLLRNLADITGRGYQTAFEQAQNLYGTEADRILRAQQLAEQSKQFGAGYGLDALRNELAARQAQGQLGRTSYETEADILARQLTGGGLQRAIEQQGIGADIAQFEQERDYPYKQVQFMQSLLQGLPLETQSYTYYEPSGLQSLAAGGRDILSILDLLSGRA
jgi:hypothetical protein